MVDRALDALMAERVMGWTWMRDGWWSPDRKQVVWADPRVEWMIAPVDAVEWSPSTDIAAAWQVVEKCEFFTLDRRPPDDSRYGVVDGVKSEDVIWGCSLTMNGVFATAVAATVPEAICRAALKSVGESLDATPVQGSRSDPL